MCDYQSRNPCPIFLLSLGQVDEAEGSPSRPSSPEGLVSFTIRVFPSPSVSSGPSGAPLIFMGNVPESMGDVRII